LGKRKSVNLARKLAPLSGGPATPGREERIVSGEFPIMASTGGVLEAMWKWQAKGAPLVGYPALHRRLLPTISWGVPRNSAHPNSAKLFVAFMTTREAQAVMESMTSARLSGGWNPDTKYVRSNKLKLQDPAGAERAVSERRHGVGEELTKIL